MGLNVNYTTNWFRTEVGAAATWGMIAARSQYTWLGFHPFGLIMCVSIAMHAMPLSIFLGWMFTALITYFGGTESYRKAIPFFLGVALGDFMMIIFWVGVDAWQGRVGHALLPF